MGMRLGCQVNKIGEMTGDQQLLYTLQPPTVLYSRHNIRPAKQGYDCSGRTKDDWHPPEIEHNYGFTTSRNFPRISATQPSSRSQTDTAMSYSLVKWGKCNFVQ